MPPNTANDASSTHSAPSAAPIAPGASGSIIHFWACSKIGLSGFSCRIWLNRSGATSIG